MDIALLMRNLCELIFVLVLAEQPFLKKHRRVVDLYFFEFLMVVLQIFFVQLLPVMIFSNKLKQFGGHVSCMSITVLFFIAIVPNSA